MNWWVQLPACLVASASFSALMHQPMKTVPVSSLIAVAGYSVFLLLSQTTLAYFLATLLIGILCEIHLRRVVVAALLFVVAASYIVGKAYLLLGVYVACETTFSVAVGAYVPRADTLVWF